jgi:hypothetical protein
MGVVVERAFAVEQMGAVGKVVSAGMTGWFYPDR